MAFAGDILPHSPLWGRAADNAAAAGRSGFDFGPMLGSLAPLLEPVDLAVCHLETPIAPAGEALSTMPLYGVPAEIADAIAAAGFDRCSTASNHTADRGVAGIDRTVEVLTAAGLGQSGMARTPDEIEPTVVDVNGIAVSHLSYTWSYNGLSLPKGEEWRSALIDPIRIVDDAREARRRGAELVVVSLHWGAEGVHEPTRYQRDVAAWLAASDSVDLIVGHHAHVVQPIEQVHGVWVVYGLGNILSNLPTSSRWPAASQDAMVVTVDATVDPDGTVVVGRPVVHPTWVDKEAGWIVRLVGPELADPATPDGRRGRLTASLDRTTAVVGDLVAPYDGG
jgi:poly-gamma-glutamate synthesis protein (capsule biosynthesis protein)